LLFYLFFIKADTLKLVNQFHSDFLIDYEFLTMDLLC